MMTRVDYKKKWQAEHKEHCKELHRAYYLKHKEEIQLKHAEYRKTHKEQIKLYYQQRDKTELGKMHRKRNSAIRRSRIKGLTVKLIQLVYEDNIKQHGTLTCYLCLEPISFGGDHLEHKTPLSRGGTNEYNNLAVACAKCNQKKGNKTDMEFSHGHSLLRR